MAGVAMDTETVAQAATDTVNAKLEVDGNLASLKALCDDLAAGWTGQGATAFANVMQAWDAEAAKLLDALQDIADSLDSSAAQQAEQDAASQSDFSAYDGEL
ncbi:WXG100 family type VII secretion target [Glycomyces rhizosphaerae]|uniref:ESAT-6-like protein n=1 Tax=Glycomyces rhizosphaerae TaxID=2054422 RepID=A0ABV7PT78_9ACTN